MNYPTKTYYVPVNQHGHRMFKLAATSVGEARHNLSKYIPDKNKRMLDWPGLKKLGFRMDTVEVRLAVKGNGFNAMRIGYVLFDSNGMVVNSMGTATEEGAFKQHATFSNYLTCPVSKGNDPIERSEAFRRAGWYATVSTCY